jgi:hypothetical protein
MMPTRALGLMALSACALQIRNVAAATWIGILLLCGTTVSSVAADDLASKAQNPIGDLIAVPIQSNFNFGVGELDRMQNVNLLQPVAPLSLGPDWNLVVRPIFPFIYQPPFFAGDDADFGLGDIQLQTYFVPKEAKQIPGGTFIWGAGPVLQARSATDDRLGSGKWAAGAGGVVFIIQQPFTYGALVNNIWSFAGDSDRADVNLMTIQPFINYNMPDGWYLTSSPVMTANWEASDGNKWTVPLGGGFGRIFNIGDQPINAQIQAFGYAARPDGGPDWSIRTQWTFLFPQ